MDADDTRQPEDLIISSEAPRHHHDEQALPSSELAAAASSRQASQERMLGPGGMLGQLMSREERRLQGQQVGG